MNTDAQRIAELEAKDPRTLTVDELYEWCELVGYKPDQAPQEDTMPTTTEKAKAWVIVALLISLDALTAAMDTLTQ